MKEKYVENQNNTALKIMNEGNDDGNKFKSMNIKSMLVWRFINFTKHVIQYV